MNDLLRSVLDAHGGLDTWERTTSLSAHLSLGGPFWARRGWPMMSAGVRVVLDTQVEHITCAPFPGVGAMSEFATAPEQLTIREPDGRTLDVRPEPRSSFPLPFDPATTRWDAVQVAYFTSCALWNYLVEPFSLARGDVASGEIAPWRERGEVWRRLAVSFPSTLPNHNADQVFYYGPDFLLRRMDYSPDVTGRPPIAHYTHDYRTFDGFAFPTRRRVHLRDAGGVASVEVAVITIDIHHIALDPPGGQ